MKIQNKKTVILLSTILILLLYTVNNLYENERILADERWYQQPCPSQNEVGYTVEYSNNCSPILHPSTIWFVIFQGTCIALGIDFLMRFKPKTVRRPLKEILNEQIEEIRKVKLEDLKPLSAAIPGFVFVFVCYMYIQLNNYDSCMNAVYHMYEDWGGYFDNPNTEGCRASSTARFFEWWYNLFGIRPGALHEHTVRNGLMLKYSISSMLLVSVYHMGAKK